MKIHATDIRTFLECRRRYYFGQVERLTPKEESTPEYFEFGSAGHKVLGAHYKKESVCNVLKEITNPEHKDHITNLIKWYVDYWQEEDSNLSVMTAEDQLCVPFNGVDIVFTVDLMALKNKKHYIIYDHKFYSKMPEQIDLTWDFQSYVYPWGMNKVGYNCREFTLNLIRKGFPELPTLLKTTGKLSTSKSALDSTDYGVFMQAIEGYGLNPDDYKNELTYLKNRGSSLFRRFSSFKMQQELEAFEQTTLIQTIDDMKRLYDETGSVKLAPPNFDQMTCPKCEFRSICKITNVGGNYELMKSGAYRVKEDNER